MMSHERALWPVKTEPGALAPPTARHRDEVEEWLLSSLPEPKRAQARTQWTDYGLAALYLGEVLSAVRLSGRLVVALTGGAIPSAEVDRFLAEALDGGPVICDPKHRRYYALVPASMPRTWRVVAGQWQAKDVEVLGRDSVVGVPRLDITQIEETLRPYWSVPMTSARALCAPIVVGRLAASGCHELVKHGGADA